MLSNIFTSALAEMWFYISSGIVVGTLLTLLIAASFKARILRNQAESLIPEIQADYQTELNDLGNLINLYADEIERYERIQAEMSLHASKIVKAATS